MGLYLIPTAPFAVCEWLIRLYHTNGLPVQFPNLRVLHNKIDFPESTLILSWICLKSNDICSNAFLEPPKAHTAEVFSTRFPTANRA